MYAVVHMYIHTFILFAIIVIIYNVTLLSLSIYKQWPLKNSYQSAISPVYSVWFWCICAHLLTTFQLTHILFGQWFPRAEIWFHYPPFTSRMAFVLRRDDILSLEVMLPLGLLMYFIFKNYTWRSHCDPKEEIFSISPIIPIYEANLWMYPCVSLK